MFCLFDYRYSLIEPQAGETLNEQIQNCVSQLLDSCEKNWKTSHVLRLVWFIGQSELQQITGFEVVQKFYAQSKKLTMAAQSFIPQSPTSGAGIQILVITLPDEDFSLEVTSGQRNYTSYVSLNHADQRWLLIGGVGRMDGSESNDQLISQAFRTISSLLSGHSMSFRDLIRQWNYIQDIIQLRQVGHEYVQNYQEFNELRNDWYQRGGLECNFPAATGIGSSAAGIIIEAIACQPGSDYQVVTLKNPLQEDAHQYSPGQLVGSKAKAAPKFERGRLIYGRGQGHIWVSGTAAIRGEQSVQGDITEQTRLTCENIDSLVSPSNLVKSGLPDSDYSVTPLYLRGYVLDQSDGPYVKGYLQNRYPGALVHVLQAAVCRKELLVEIEGEMGMKEMQDAKCRMTNI